MTKQVSGYLAPDGRFFETQAECIRYEASRALQGLCESHEVNYENFMAMINGWHKLIREYLDADANCKERQANGGEVALTFEQLPSLEVDNEDDTGGIEDSQTFQQFAVRRNK